jgi:hypothetical protein
MGERISEYRILVEITEGRRPLGKPRRRYEDNIKVDFQEVGQGGMGWVALAEDRDFGWRLRMFRKILRFCGRAEELLASQVGLCSVELECETRWYI